MLSGERPAIRLSVATNFSDGLVEGLGGYPVQELFGKLSSDSVGGGRASFMVPAVGARGLRRHVALARERGIGFNYLLNAACLDNRDCARKGQKELRRLLDFIEGCGIGGVTVSLPSLLPVIKKAHPRLKVKVGVYARVDGVVKARFWEDLGADCITLESISVNRDLRLLEAIRKSVRAELQLLVNSNCLMFCPLSGQHMTALSHASQSGHESRGFMLDYCVLRCSYEKLRDPVNYLRSEFIRPEDLSVYAGMGYTSFKILERGAPTSVMLKRVKAYADGRFDGNLLELIQPYGYREKAGSAMSGAYGFLRYFFRPGQVRLGGLMRLKRLAAARGLLGPVEGEPVYIDNRALDGFLAGARGIDCRSLACGDCGYCASYAKDAVRVDGGYRERTLALYEGCFEDMRTGRLWGLG